jgi:hypothetical protein
MRRVQDFTGSVEEDFGNCLDNLARLYSCLEEKRQELEMAELSYKLRKLEEQNQELEKKLEQHKNVQPPTQTSTKRNYNARTFPEARRWTNDGKPICSNCLKVGHIAKDCRLGGKSMRRSFSPPYGCPNYYPYPPRRPNNSNELRRDNRNPPRTPPTIKKEPIGVLGK